MDDLKTTLTNIADAIRYKLSTDDLIAPVDFALNILSIPVEGGGYSDPTPIINGTVKTVSNTASFTRSAAFAYCYNLTTAHLSLCENVGGETFANCSKLKAVNLDKCKNIQYDAFYGCNKLSKISIPLCETIGISAFQNAGLQSIILPECTTIDAYAFYHCRSLTTAYLPNVTSIGSGAFEGCENLNEVTLGSSTMCELSDVNVFYGTQFYTEYDTGSGGIIYVPAELVDAYKADPVWNELLQDEEQQPNQILPIPT